MRCQEVRENLGAYLLQKLSKEESAFIMEHLVNCVICTHELDNLRQVDGTLEHLSMIEPSASFDARLFARLDEMGTQRGEKWFSWGRTWLADRYAWSLVVLLITTVGIWIGIRHQQYRELNSLQKVIEVQDRYLGSLQEKKISRSRLSDSVTESTTTNVFKGEKASETPINKDEEIPEEDKALLENLELLQDYEILNSFEIADHRKTLKPRATD